MNTTILGLKKQFVKSGEDFLTYQDKLSAPTITGLITPIPSRVTEIPVYRFAWGKIAQNKRFVVASQLLDFASSEDITPTSAATFLFTIVEIIFPGLCDALYRNSKSRTWNFNYVNFDEDMTKWFYGGPKEVTEQTVGTEAAAQGQGEEQQAAEGAGNQAAEAETTDNDTTITATFVIMEHLEGYRLEWSEDRQINHTEVFICAVIGVSLWCISKQPTEANESAFTTRRFDAIQKKYSEESYDNLSKPSLLFYKMIHGFFNKEIGLRIVTVDVFWTFCGAEEYDTLKSIVATTIKLWAGANMSHVNMINSLILGYFDVLIQIPLLIAELKLWFDEMGKVSQNTDVSIYKVKFGDKTKYLQARKYPELLKIAKTLAVLNDPRLAQYAATIVPGPTYTMFEIIASKEGKMPTPQPVLEPLTAETVVE